MCYICIVLHATCVLVTLCCHFCAFACFQDDIETLIAEFQAADKKKVEVREERCEAPSRRY